MLGATDDATLDEDAPTNAVAVVRYRPRFEQRVLAARADDVRAVVVRPGIVYGQGGGIPGLMVGWAHEHRIGRYRHHLVRHPVQYGARVGLGHSGLSGARWPIVHVDDLANLFVLAAADVAAGGSRRAVAPTRPYVLTELAGDTRGRLHQLSRSTPPPPRAGENGPGRKRGNPTATGPTQGLRTTARPDVGFTAVRSSRPSAAPTPRASPGPTRPRSIDSAVDLRRENESEGPPVAR